MASQATHVLSEPSVKAINAKVRVEGVEVVFDRDGKKTDVLDNINLEVAEGEFLCILGPSGCGKSTLLNTIAGFLSPTAGRVVIGGEVVTGPDPRRIFVFQGGAFSMAGRGGQYVGFGLFKLPREERERRIKYYARLVGLEGFEKTYPQELSGGMKQRLEVARALAVNPDMLLLDEPFGALDSITRLTMRRELLRIWHAEKKTIIFVTHDIEEAVQLAHSRVIIHERRPPESDCRNRHSASARYQFPPLSGLARWHLRADRDCAQNMSALSQPAKWEKFFWPLLTASLGLVIWYYAVEITKTSVFPTPASVVRGMVELARKGVLLNDIAASLHRVALGYLTAALLGVPIGLMLGWYPAVSRVVNPFIQLVRPISPIAWIPLAIIWFGVGDAAATYLIFVGSFLSIVVARTEREMSLPSTGAPAGTSVSTRLVFWQRWFFPRRCHKSLSGCAYRWESHGW